MQIKLVYKLTVTENFVVDKRLLHTVFWWQHLGTNTMSKAQSWLCHSSFCCHQLRAIAMLMTIWNYWPSWFWYNFEDWSHVGDSVMLLTLRWWHFYDINQNRHQQKIFAKSTIFENWHHWLFTEKKSADCPQIFDTRSFLIHQSCFECIFMYFQVFLCIWANLTHFSASFLWSRT